MVKEGQKSVRSGQSVTYDLCTVQAIFFSDVNLTKLYLKYLSNISFEIRRKLKTHTPEVPRLLAGFFDIRQGIQNNKGMNCNTSRPTIKIPERILFYVEIYKVLTKSLPKFRSC